MHCCSLNSVSVNEVLQYFGWMLYYKHNHLNAYKTSADGFACQCGTDVFLVSFWLALSALAHIDNSVSVIFSAVMDTDALHILLFWVQFFCHEEERENLMWLQP